jgi:hypothetical protein
MEVFMCDDGEFNLEERVLCSDDTCIGLIGEDGRCKVCGMPYEGPEQLPVLTDETGEAHEPPDDETRSAGVSDWNDENAIAPEERICCPDDTCIGIIGPDGRCGTCGRYA